MAKPVAEMPHEKFPANKKRIREHVKAEFIFLGAHHKLRGNGIRVCGNLGWVLETPWGTLCLDIFVTSPFSARPRKKFSALGMGIELL